jgi:hypothetical protein
MVEERLAVTEDDLLVRFTAGAGLITTGDRWLAWLTSSLTRCVLRVNTDFEAARGATATDRGAMTLF